MAIAAAPAPTKQSTAPESTEPPPGPPTETTSTNPPLDATYRFIQLSIGLMSFLLPILTLGGAWMFGRQHPDSISTTYYTHARGVFVGGLCAIGFLFLAYQRRGCDSGAVSPDKAKEYHVDQVLSRLCGVAATVLAVVPTSNCENRLLGSQPACPAWWTQHWLPGFIHAVATAVLMAAVATLCLRQFVRTTDSLAPEMKEKRRLARVFRRATYVPAVHSRVTRDRLRANVVYRVCGIIIVVCVLCIVGFGIVDLCSKGVRKREVSLIEGIAFWAFSVAWLTKSDYVQWKPWPRFTSDPDRGKPSKAPAEAVTH